MRKQLVEKESWYKETEKDEEETGSPNKYRNTHRGGRRPASGAGSRRITRSGLAGNNNKIKTLIFVPLPETAS